MNFLEDIIYKTMTIRQISEADVRRKNSEGEPSWFMLNGSYYEFSFPGAQELLDAYLERSKAGDVPSTPQSEGDE